MMPKPDYRAQVRKLIVQLDREEKQIAILSTHIQGTHKVVALMEVRKRIQEAVRGLLQSA